MAEARDKTTAGYKMTVTVEFTEVNKYQDELSGGTIKVTKVLKAQSMTELARVLARIDALHARPAAREESGA